MFDRESLFQMLMNKEWDKISGILYRNPELLQSDPIIKQAIDLFEKEFFSDTQSLDHESKLKVFEFTNLVVELKQKSFSKEFVENFIDEKLNSLKALNHDTLISYAASHQDRPIAREILKGIQEEKPEAIADARRESVTVKSTDINNGVSKTIKLFKSRQEEYFFEAIRKAFPTYHPYPNVALSCILDFNAISHLLNDKQKSYFFRAVIDSVVFDTSNGHEPMFFFELDSNYHDSDSAQENDEMKNSIFEVANVKLIRIRSYDEKEVSVEKFKKLVTEVMRNI